MESKYLRATPTAAGLSSDRWTDDWQDWQYWRDWQHWVPGTLPAETLVMGRVSHIKQTGGLCEVLGVVGRSFGLLRCSWTLPGGVPGAR